ncbi:MAG: protein-L-isoaspartate O-methyltransferase [Parasphingopyxis sp.]|uniref:protein-L-isoaspartate O-methyltransferase family protein n=1 Tax=Parasphingopyxis sp. TaxID=1920299 RepID=UPI0032ECE720
MSLDFQMMREAMVESQLRTTGVDDMRVIRAMATVPREDFVPEERRRVAYAEMAVPLGEGRRMNLPMATGRMLAELGLRDDDHALVIGAATGYSAAICARIAKSVVALEEDAGLAARARELLAGTDTIEVVEGPLDQGWSDGAPYDAILIDGMVETIPEAVTEQLADGGRLTAAVLENGVSRLFFGRREGGAFGAASFADSLASTLPGFEQPKAFTF